MPKIARATSLRPEPGEYRRRLRPHRPPVDAAAGSPGLAADEHVLRHGQVREQGRLLVDDRDPGRARRRRAVQRDLPAVHQQRPGVRLIHPGEDLHQRRLARAVLADQGVRRFLRHGCGNHVVRP